ncbi:MAG: COX15/CtaA family protein [Bacteroidota bacterium]
MNKDKAIITWLASGCILIFLMVVIGGITRLTGSGLSITEWKVITGTLPPLSEEAWQEEFNNYKKIPQYQLLNSDFQLSDFKAIYFWEYIHRLIGRMIGIVFLIPFIYFWMKKRISKELMPRLYIMFLLGALQGVIGWYMVSSGLTQNVRVSHYRLALHLGTAFITFGYIFYVMLQESGKYKRSINKEKNNFPLVILLLVFIQIILGAFVAGTHAGYVYNTWPDMEGEWVPSSIPFAFEKNGWTSLFDNLATVQFVHRCMAYVVTVVILFWWWKQRNSISDERKRIVNLLLSVLFVQVILGIYTLLAHVPVWMGVTHQAMAFVLFASAIWQYYIYQTKVSSS